MQHWHGLTTRLEEDNSLSPLVIIKSLYPQRETKCLLTSSSKMLNFFSKRWWCMPCSLHPVRRLSNLTLATGRDHVPLHPSREKCPEEIMKHTRFLSCNKKAHHYFFRKKRVFFSEEIMMPAGVSLPVQGLIISSEKNAYFFLKK